MKIQPRLLFAVLVSAMIFNAVADSLTNLVPLTANLTFYLQDEFHGGIPTNKFKSDEMILETILVNGTNISNGHGLWAGTNIVSYRILPSYDQFYNFKLLNDKGQEVPKTIEGLAYSKPAKPPRNEFDLRRNFKIHPVKAADARTMFRPDEMFVITNKGIYELEVRIRICVPMTNGVPDTNTMMDFRKTARAENFGVIESAPVRVNVIKE
jgi:hypothetical protein